MRRRSIMLSLASVLISGALGFNLVITPRVYSSELPTEHKAAVSSTKSLVADKTTKTSQKSAPEQTTQTTSTTHGVNTHPRVATAALTGNNLSIPSIGFHAPIVSVGLTTSNAIDVPTGMQVGYYVGSAQPGTPGAAFLDGHLDGVFPKLHEVSVGQMLSVAYGGQIFTYRVVATEIVILDGIDMNRALSVQGGTEGLNIMTCAGTYVRSAGTYDKRLIIYTVRVP